MLGNAVARPLRHLLAGPWGPLWVGALSTSLTWWVWGYRDPLPVFHDEVAYVLQSRIFASGRWTSPPPPMPEPFEQFHVLLQPVMAAKYHPGQSLALVPGVLLGQPALGVLVVSGLSGGLLFALARRLAGVRIATLTALLWLLAPINLKFRSSYFSEVTTALLWVGAFYSLHRWDREHGRSWLVTLSLVVSACLVTRPLSGLVLGAVAAVVVLALIRRKGRVWDLALPLLVGLTVPALLGLWHWETTGSLWESPRDLYTRQYMPWDRIGFGPDSTPPSIPLSADFQRFRLEFDTVHVAYTPSRVPAALVQRTWAFLKDALGPGIVILGILTAVGAKRRRAEAWVGLGAVALFLAMHLLYAHPKHWTLYYLEGQPVLAFFTAVGASEVCRWPRADVTAAAARWQRGQAIACRILLVVCLLIGLVEASLLRDRHRKDQRHVRQFREVLGRLDGQWAVVFVRYGPKDPYMSLIANGPDIARAPVWVVLDLGERINRELLARADGREPWLFDDCTERLSRGMPSQSVPADSGLTTKCR